MIEINESKLSRNSLIILCYRARMTLAVSFMTTRDSEHELFDYLKKGLFKYFKHLSSVFKTNISYLLSYYS